MQGLVQKYLRNWMASLRHSLLAQLLMTRPDEACAWNAGIAATAIRDWCEARRQWSRCGIALPGVDGPVMADLGIAAVRLNPWADRETVFARRLDPVRARLLNIPLPESGYRFGDIVLHDGVPVGRQHVGQRAVPVFNAMERWQPSRFMTFTAKVGSPDEAALAPLLAGKGPGIAELEDWTASVAFVSARARAPSRVAAGTEKPAWRPSRYIGIAAESHAAAEAALARWRAGGPGRIADAVDGRAFPEPPPRDGQVWWEPDPGRAAR